MRNPGLAARSLPQPPKQLRAPTQEALKLQGPGNTPHGPAPAPGWTQLCLSLRLSRSPAGAMATGSVFSPATSSTQNTDRSPSKPRGDGSLTRRLHFKTAPRFRIGCEAPVRQPGASARGSRLVGGERWAGPDQATPPSAQGCARLLGGLLTTDAGGRAGSAPP